MLGKGMIMDGSKKQTINMQSSTQAEIVGVDDYARPILCTNYFMEAQRFKPRKTVIYQDNQSAILLEKNGKELSGKHFRHMNIKYFFIKDRVEKGEVAIEFCLTENMVADHTKPLQGQVF